MPPKPRFTREAIVEAALELVCEQGAEHLTARELAKKLECSSQPIFTVFEDMDEVRRATREAASRIMQDITTQPTDNMPAFKSAGMQIVLIAMEKPNLFKFAYMTGDGPVSFDEAAAEFGGAPEGFIRYIRQEYGLTDEEARTLFQHTWVFTYGLGMLCATGMCTFSTEELSQKLTQNFVSMLMFIKAGWLNKPMVPPQEIARPE